jgi:hypothetical protein
VDTFLYGRRVWEMMVGYWPTAEEVSDHPHDRWFAPIWRATPRATVCDNGVTVLLHRTNGVESSLR